jgi:hypothetical protein
MAALIRGITFSLAIFALLAQTAHSSERVLKRFGSGTGLDAVGMVDASEDTEASAPQALYAGQNGQMYLLDQVNGRILEFNSRHPAESTRSLELPGNLQPTDLVVGKRDIYVWDGDVHQLHPTASDDSSTRGLEEVITRGGPDDFAVGTFAQMGSQRPGDEAELLDANTRGIVLKKPRARVRQMIQTHGAGDVVADVIPGSALSKAEIEVRPKGETRPLATLKVDVKNRLGAVEFLDIDSERHFYVLAEDVPDTTETLASAFVIRYSPEGRAEAVFDLPLSDSIALSRRFVTVSENGEVYFLRTRPGSVEVVAVGHRPVRGNAPISGLRLRNDDTNTAKLRHDGPIAAVREQSRQQVIETAFAFANTRWRLNPAAYGRDPDNACTGFHRIRRPPYLFGKLNQDVQGIPYCWGCFGSLNQIRVKIEHGVLAGNVCTRNAPRTDVVGVDCSAFVSAAWGLAHHFTTIAIPTISRPLASPWDLQPGDALNKAGSHVVLFLRFTPDRKAEVMEASPGACNGRVCRNVYPLSSLLARGFQPVRFRALENQQVAQLPSKTDSAPKQQVSDRPALRKHHGRHRSHGR